jgi:hypothetical protein
MTILRGQRLSADLVRRIADRAEGAARLRVTGGRSVGGPLGQTFAPDRPNRYPSLVYDMACADLNVPLFSLVEWDDSLVDPNGRPTLPRCSKVSRPWSSRIGVTLKPVLNADLQIIPVQTAGVQLLKYCFTGTSADLFTGTADVQPGDTLGGVPNRDYAVGPQDGNQGGPLQVLAVADHDATWTDYNFALTLITNDRLDWQRYTDYYGGHIADGNFQVLVVGTDWTVTAEQPGVLRLDPV